MVAPEVVRKLGIDAGDAVALLERPQLLEVVELAVEHVGLGGAARNVLLKRRTELLGRLEATDQAPGLHERVLVPATDELGGHLRLAAPPGLTHLLSGIHRGDDRTR